ncbi:hypothetical protein HUT16_34290 [Kitasatospora sp. NA04385]|uniref:hypothetical protein n=1 Tax=Kitasatospora sp. NA04385 TaxID=2742135 RepID=UPI00159238A9|nr:hypothetical protein [Kitasatospora sp. NA04385]QKW23489.1 hypothetical protein HUT16_34290 [Kitasatospora sp. NA04385]
MDTHTGRTAGRTELRTAEPHSAGDTELLADGLPTEDLLPDEAADPFADAFAEALADALAEPSAPAPGSGPGPGPGTAPDGADDPGWDYEDVILRSVN